MRVPPIRILTAALVIHALLFAVSAVNSSKPAGDFDRYYEIGSSAGRPYVDYQVEHPIATLLVFTSLAHVPGGRVSFGLGVVVLDAIGDAIIIAALVWGWGLAAAAFFAAALIPVLGLFFNRIDAWSTAAAILAVVGWRRERPLWLGIALALGGAFKLWPLVLAPLLIVPWRSRQSVTAIAAFGATASLLAGATLWIAGPRGVVQVLTFRGATGWQIESVVGSLIHLASGESPRLESGSWRIGAMNAGAAIGMFLAAGPLSLWSSWRGARLNRIGAGWLASVSVLMLLSALLSAQYVIWLLPAAAIAWADGDRRLALLAAGAALLTEILWIGYADVVSGVVWALWIIVFRNAVLAALAIGAITQITGRQRKNHTANSA